MNNGYFLTFALIGLLYNITTLDNPDRDVFLACLGFIPFAIVSIAKGITEEK